MPRPRALRGGQASAITVAILTSAVLALGLALYAYFAGHASRAYESEALANIYGDYASRVTVHVEASYVNTSTPVETACYIVSINNIAGEPRALYLTVLPASQASPGGLRLDPAVSRLPLDTSYEPPRLRVLLFKLEDVNGDGVDDVVGAGGRVVKGNPWLPTCDEIYSLPYREKVTLTLPYTTAQPGNVEVGLTKISLDQLASSTGTRLAGIPLWRLTLGPNGKVTLFIYVELPSRPSTLSLVTLFQFNGRYYTATLTSLPLG